MLINKQFVDQHYRIHALVQSVGTSQFESSQQQQSFDT